MAYTPAPSDDTRELLVVGMTLAEVFFEDMTRFPIIQTYYEEDGASRGTRAGLTYLIPYAIALWRDYGDNLCREWSHDYEVAEWVLSHAKFTGYDDVGDPIFTLDPSWSMVLENELREEV